MISFLKSFFQKRYSPKKAHRVWMNWFEKNAIAPELTRFETWEFREDGIHMKDGYLFLKDQTITSPLPPLEWFINLMDFNLDHAQYEHQYVEALFRYSHLYGINIDGASYTELPDISTLTDLCTLSVEHCQQLTSIEPVRALHRLLSVYLSHTSIISFDPLAKHPLLTTINADYCTHLDLTSLSRLSTLPKLTKLSLKGSSLHKLDELPHLPALEELDLSECEHLSSLLHTPGQFPKLTTLYLAETGLTSLEGLELFPNLTSLRLVKCTHLGQEDYEYITVCSELQELNISLSQIDTLPDFSSLKHLRKLSAYYLQQVRDVHHLFSLPHLEKLDMTGVTISFEQPCPDGEFFVHGKDIILPTRDAPDYELEHMDWVDPDMDTSA